MRFKRLRKLVRIIIAFTLFAGMLCFYRYILEEIEDLLYKNYCAMPKKVVPLGYNPKVCLIPNINPFDPLIMKLVKDVEPLQCATKKRAILKGGYLKITDPNVIGASYRKVIRPPGNDFNSTLGKPIELQVTGNDIPIKDEFIELKLKTNQGKMYREFLLQAVRRQEVVARAKGHTELGLSVLVIGVESVSNAQAQRKLPKSYQFMKETMESYIFMGHTVVGDGTTEQLAALLTGKGERGYAEARRKMHGTKSIDHWNWVFKNAKNKGYVTSFSEDAPSVGTFQYRLTGFREPPTDYYPRPFYIEADKYYDRGKNSDCYGSEKIHNYHLDLARGIYEQYPDRSKFLFHFASHLPHNILNNVQKMDDDLLRFMTHFKDTNYLNNTVLILLGDHGWRYGAFRQTVQGKLEERLPLFAMAFPRWFKKRYPELDKILKINTNRLTSWFDGYATLNHLLDYPKEPEKSKHGVSLLTEVPLGRNCNDAGIPTHWCPCVLWSEVNHNHNHLKRAVALAVGHINSLNFHEPLAEGKCAKLEVKELSLAEVETPGTALLQFYDTRDGDGFTPTYHRAARLKDVCHYRLTFTASPSNGVYEANVNYVHGRFIVEKGVSRINAYGDQPRCIADTLPHLRKYCYCKGEK